MTRLFALGCAAYVAAWVWAVVALPPRVPLHFGPGGEVDRWGSRMEALVAFGVLGPVVAAVFVGSLVMVRRGRLQLLNVPHRSWWTETAERRDRVRVMAAHDMALTGAATMALLAGALVGTVVAAGRPEPALPGWFFVVLGGYLLGIVAWTVYAHRTRYRPVVE